MVKKNEHLTELKITCNPFDIIYQSYIELARAFLFFPHRVGDNTSIQFSWDAVEGYKERIDTAIKQIEQLTPDELELVRTTSYAYANLDEKNHILVDLFRDVPTVYSKSMPRYNLDYEKVLFGEDSEKYIRRRELDNILETTKVSLNFLESVSNVNSGYRSQTDESYNENAKEFIDKYNLNENDIDYMISCLE